MAKGSSKNGTERKEPLKNPIDQGDGLVTVPPGFELERKPRMPDGDNRICEEEILTSTNNIGIDEEHKEKIKRPSKERFYVAPGYRQKSASPQHQPNSPPSILPSSSAENWKKKIILRRSFPEETKGEHAEDKPPSLTLVKVEEIEKTSADEKQKKKRSFRKSTAGKEETNIAISLAEKAKQGKQNLLTPEKADERTTPEASPTGKRNENRAQRNSITDEESNSGSSEKVKEKQTLVTLEKLEKTTIEQKISPIEKKKTNRQPRKSTTGAETKASFLDNVQKEQPLVTPEKVEKSTPESKKSPTEKKKTDRQQRKSTADEEPKVSFLDKVKEEQTPGKVEKITPEHKKKSPVEKHTSSRKHPSEESGEHHPFKKTDEKPKKETLEKSKETSKSPSKSKSNRSRRSRQITSKSKSPPVESPLAEEAIETPNNPMEPCSRIKTETVCQVNVNTLEEIKVKEDSPKSPSSETSSKRSPRREGKRSTKKNSKNQMSGELKEAAGESHAVQQQKFPKEETKALSEQREEEDLLSTIPLPAPVEPTWEEKLDSDTIEDPQQQHERNYAQQFLQESAGVKYPKTQGAKVVLDPQVMRDYGHVFNYWETQHKKQIEARGDVPSVITIVDGDVFSATCSLAHCVSEDFRMSSGVAVPFRKRYGHVADLLNQRRKTGEVAVLTNGNRFIYYMVTKELYLGKPEGIMVYWQTLSAMREHALQNGVRDIAMPKIGCGRDHMHWPDIAEAIQCTFAETGIRITVYQMAEPGPSWPLKRPPSFPLFSTPPPAKRPKADYWPPAPQEPNPQRPLIVQHLFNSNIIESRPPIVRIFLTSCQSCPPEGGAAVLNATFKFWNELLVKERLLGTNVPLFSGQISALVVRQEARDPIDFKALQNAAKELANLTHAMGLQRLVLQGFTLPEDKMITYKVLTILRLALNNQNLTLNVAWPEEPPYGSLIRSAQQGYANHQQQQQSGPPPLGPNEYDY